MNKYSIRRNLLAVTLYASTPKGCALRERGPRLALPRNFMGPENYRLMLHSMRPAKSLYGYLAAPRKGAV
jgi:hypothetical protein